MANPASQTAIGPMTIVAVEQYTEPPQRLVQDELAIHFLPGSIRFITRLARWRPVRAMLFNATEKSAPGIWGSALCRKRYIAEKISKLSDEMEAVVILGAGLDTLAYRLTDRAGVPIFEVDLPENSEYKRARVQALFGEIPAAVRLAPVDFETQALGTVLAEQGYHHGMKTFFVWEAVTQYLTEEAVRGTFTFLARAAAGSRLIFTYIRQDFMDGTNLYGAGNIYQRFRVKQALWRFGMRPDAVAGFLAEYGWHAVEQMDAQAFDQRYLRSSGRELAVSGMERVVYAQKG